MSLLQEINREVDGTQPVEGPAVPDGWSVGHLANHGIILSCDGFQLKLNLDELNKLFDIAEDGEPGEIRDQNGTIVLVEPTDNTIVLTRTGDETYPSGITLDPHTLAEIGIVAHEEDDEEDESLQDPESEEADAAEGDTIAKDDELAQEGIKAAYRRSGGKIKKGFRVTSGCRKGRVVANIKTAYKPRAKASTRMKLKIASKKKRLVRVMKSKRTRKKSLSKRLARMNAMKK